MNANEHKSFNNSWLLQHPIAHRGFHSGDQACPENSMKAFRKALQKGFAIELDVQLLSDGKVVVFHDENTKRMTGFNRKIGDCDSHRISKMRLLDSDQHIPLLKAVLDLVKGKVPLFIEIKNKGRVGMLEKALFDILESYDGRFAVQSFNPYSLQWFRINAPFILRGQLSGDFRGEAFSFFKKAGGGSLNIFMKIFQ